MKRALVAAVTGLALLLTPAIAGAQPAEAGAAFERGVAFFRDGDYTAAMVEFKKAYELDPNWRVLYNLGQTSRELREYSAALTSFERYLAEGGDQVDAERKKKVEGWISELKGKVATLNLKIDVEGADVTVDDIAVGKTPLDKPLVVNAGRRKLTVTKSGYAPLNRFIDVAGTEQKSLELELVPLTGPSGGGTRDTGSKPSPLGPAEQPEGASPWPWAVFGVAAAAGTATAVLGGLALSKKSDFDDQLTTYPNDAASIDDARDEARTLAIAADVMGGVTIAAVVVTIIGFAVEGAKGDSATQGRAPLRFTAGPTWVGLDGSF